MKTDPVFYATAPQGAVSFLDGRDVEPVPALALTYDAWRAFDPEPPLPCTPLRWLALTQRRAALAAFPRFTPTGATDHV